MLTKRDYNIVKELNDNKEPIFYGDEKIEKILFYEQKYKKNSIDIIYEIFNPNDYEKNDWQKLVEEFIRDNKDINLINKVFPIKKFLISTQIESNVIKKMLDYICSCKNSIAIITNECKNYKQVIQYANLKKKIIILVTNDPSDFEFNASNLLICFSPEAFNTGLSLADVYLLEECKCDIFSYQYFSDELKRKILLI